MPVVKAAEKTFLKDVEAEQLRFENLSVFLEQFKVNDLYLMPTFDLPVERDKLNMNYCIV